MRMQAFRMQEFVYLGDSEAALDFRDRWLNHGSDLLRGLGLEVSTMASLTKC
jgi:seryl-tRNA synthetase